MARRRRRSKGSGSEEESPSLLGPFMVPDPYGLGVLIPRPLSAGRPPPEPEERWTLAPGRMAADAGEHQPPTTEEPVRPRRRRWPFHVAWPFRRGGPRSG